MGWLFDGSTKFIAVCDFCNLPTLTHHLIPHQSKPQILYMMCETCYIKRETKEKQKEIINKAVIV